MTPCSHPYVQSISEARQFYLSHIFYQLCHLHHCPSDAVATSLTWTAATASFQGSLPPLLHPTAPPRFCQSDRSQAQLRAGTPAASAKQLPVPLGWLLGQSHHRHAQPTTASGWIEARCRAPLRSLATRRLPHCRQPCPLCRTGTGKGPLAHKHLPITSCVPGLGRHQGKTSGLCSAGPTAHAPPSPGSGPGVPQPFPRGVLGLPSAEALAHST